jgi:hypothetical protein
MGYRKICNKAKTDTHLNKSNFMLFNSFSFFWLKIVINSLKRSMYGFLGQRMVPRCA